MRGRFQSDKRMDTPEGSERILVRGPIRVELRFVTHPVAGRDDLNGSAFHFCQEPIQHRTMNQDIPAGARGLSKDDMSDAFSLSELDQSIRGPFGFHFDDGRSHLYGQLNVFGELLRIFGLDSRRLLQRRFHINGIPVCPRTSGDARARPQEWLGRLV